MVDGTGFAVMVLDAFFGANQVRPAPGANRGFDRRAAPPPVSPAACSTRLAIGGEILFRRFARSCWRSIYDRAQRRITA
jgi:hypothetical protein